MIPVLSGAATATRAIFVGIFIGVYGLCINTTLPLPAPNGIGCDIDRDSEVC